MIEVVTFEAPAGPVSKTDARRALFSEHPVLGLLAPQELEHVLGFAVLRSYGPGAEIFGKGESGHSMMLIVSGEVKISVSTADGKEAVLAILHAGEILGEMAILDNKPRSADATAVTSCKLLALHQRDFLPFLERNPALCIRLLAMTSERLRRTSALLEERILRHAPGRLARALLEAGKCEGGRCPPGACVELAISQKTFASLVGISRETLNKQLHAWEAAGLIALRRNAVVIQKPDALLQIAEG